MHTLLPMNHNDSSGNKIFDVISSFDISLAIDTIRISFAGDLGARSFQVRREENVKGQPSIS